MSTDRRDFLGTLMAAGVLPLAGLPDVTAGEPAGGAVASPRDLPWIRRLRGKYRAVFDNPRDDGTGIIRAWIWMNQCKAAFGASDDECGAVVVLRHGAIMLGMSDAFWEGYEVALGNPNAEKPNIPKRNPQMAAAMQEQMGSFPPAARAVADGLGIDTLMERGGIVVGCEFAFAGVVSLVRRKDSVEEAVARERALSYLLPGVTLVPSGFFALAVAQSQGCAFVTNT